MMLVLIKKANLKDAEFFCKGRNKSSVWKKALSQELWTSQYKFSVIFWNTFWAADRRGYFVLFYFPSRAANSLRGHPLCYFKSSPVLQQGGQEVHPSQPGMCGSRPVPQAVGALRLLLMLCSGVPDYSHPLMTTAGRQEAEEHKEQPLPAVVA